MYILFAYEMNFLGSTNDVFRYFSRDLLSPSGNGRKTLAFSPQNGIFAWLRPAHKEEIMSLKNSVPLCLCAFDPQAIPFRDSS